MSDLQETADFIEQYGLKDDAEKVRKAADRIEKLEKTINAQGDERVVAGNIVNELAAKLKIAEDAIRKARTAIVDGDDKVAYALLGDILKQIRGE
jgi:CMP-2-keto-3-deoxyoctulosonic acid synthetase